MGIYNNRGLANELKASYYYHSNYTPLLISPTILRRYGAGQVDIAYIDKEHDEFVIRIVEVKSSQRFSNFQKVRLKKSAQLLSSYFDIVCHTSVLFCCLSKH